MRGAMRRSRRWVSSVGRECLRSELERGADVNRLAIAAVILQRGQAIALDIVADASRERDVPREGVGTADINRDVVTAAQAGDRIAGRPVSTDRDSGAQPTAERIADTEDGGLAAARRRVGALNLCHVAGNGETPPANRNAEVVSSRSQRVDGRRRRARLSKLRLRRRQRTRANSNADLRW